MKALTCWLARSLRSRAPADSDSTRLSRKTPDSTSTTTVTSATINRIRRSRSDMAILGRRTAVCAIFTEFIEQSFLADAEDFGGPRLVVAGVFEGKLDEGALGLL